MAIFKIVEKNKAFSNLIQYSDDEVLYKLADYCVTDKETDGLFTYFGGHYLNSLLPVDVAGEMQQVQEVFSKTEGRKLFHFVLGFAPHEGVTPRLAYDIVWNATRCYPDHQVYFGVHEDNGPERLHAHIIVNTVSFITGEKFAHDYEVQYHYAQAITAECIYRGLPIRVNVVNHNTVRR